MPDADTASDLLPPPPPPPVECVVGEAGAESRRRRIIYLLLVLLVSSGGSGRCSTGRARYPAALSLSCWSGGLCCRLLRCLFVV